MRLVAVWSYATLAGLLADNDAMEDFVRKSATGTWHASCTCRMGVDKLAVVDPDTFRVHGVEGLRVVDAAVMPTITNANIYAPVIMIAEKAADAILGNEPLQPLSIDIDAADAALLKNCAP